MKEHKHILMLLGIGAVILLVYLLRRSAAPIGIAAPTPISAGTDAAASAGGYPNGAPIKLGDFEVGPSPINLTYNSGGGHLAPVQIGGTESGCPCNDDPCATAQTLTTVNHVPVSALQAAVDNFGGYADKLTGLLQAPGADVALY